MQPYILPFPYSILSFMPLQLMPLSTVTQLDFVTWFISEETRMTGLQTTETILTVV